MSEPKPVIPPLFPGTLVSAGFTTRVGGMSGVPYDSLNLGFNTPDNPVHVSENWRRLTGFLNIDLFCVARMGQVHGVTVQRVDRGGVYPGTDGLITGASGVLLCVMVADCTPLLLFDPDNHAAAAVHCGWRSLTGGIVERTVEAMRKEFGSLAENLLAATGPSAGSCCYEIGPEVAGLLHRDAVINREGRLYGDIRADITFRLTEIGVDCANIDNNSDCSIHMDSLYFSHRRDSSSSGRMAGYIMLR